ncbi:MAG: methionyl-tRNA formyltransferase [Eubacteriales bacterium]
MNIIFMGTPEFAVPTLEKLIENKNIDISLVITQPDRKSGRGRKTTKSPIKVLAEENKIDLFQPKNINNLKSIDFIKDIEADYIVVVAYGQILHKEILKHPKKSCINLHASLLPKYRGAAPINWAIIKGEKVTGVTTMIMEEGLDTGDILKTKKVNINNKMNAGELHDILKDIGGELLIETIEGIEAQKILPKKQNEAVASYAPMLNKKTGLINWENTAENIHNKIRGLYPWPGSYTYYEGCKFKITKSKYISKNKGGTIGEIVGISDSGIEVQTGNGILLINELQIPGKRKMSVKDYLLGNNIKVNVILK